MTQKPDREALGKELFGLKKAGCSYSELAAKYGMTTGMVKGLVRTAMLSAPKEFEVVHLGTPLDLRGDFMVVGDVHVPTTDYEFAGLVSRVAVKNGIKRLIIGGDMFNMDSFSTYDMVTASPTWSEERDAARILFSDWLKVFDRIYVIMGNHDRRMQKWARGALDEKDIFGMVTSTDRMEISNFGYLTVHTPAQYPWRVTHSKNYSVNQLSVAGELANKFQCNVISHHEHHCAIGFDKYKRFVVVNNGGLFDESQFAYVKLDDSKMPGMANSFTMLKNGVATLFGKYPFTDWGGYF